MCLKVKVLPLSLPSLMGMSKVPGPLRMSEPDSHAGSCPVTFSGTGSGTSACDQDCAPYCHVKRSICNLSCMHLYSLLKLGMALLRCSKMEEPG